MKKYLLSLLMLCCMTVAWAGTGTGTKDDPYTGEWRASELMSKLKEGSHLAYNCVINAVGSGGITVFDDKLGNAEIIPNWSSWAVGSPIEKDPEQYTANDLFRVYGDYCSLNSPEDKKNHTFIVTKIEHPAANSYRITGHYSGHYDRGDGTKENPYCGEWQASELGPKLEPGVYLDFSCAIKDGRITVNDIILDKNVANSWTAWAPGNLIGDPQSGSDYYQYGQDNSAANRRGQSFILTYVSPSAKTSTSFTIKGYFSGFYRTTDSDGFYHVYTAKQMETILNGNAHAKVRLTGDIYLSDKSNDNTFCSTFYGTIDGDGYTINGSKDGTRQNRNYLFTYSDGATFKNLTFKQIRKNSADHSNQAIITSQAKNHCVFENITFENVGTFSNYDNAGTAAGYATDCTFTDITVKDSDCTVDGDQAGCVVGHAMGCTFTNIKVENCESTADDEKAGGVVGRADNCTFSHVEILGTFIQTNGFYAGGVAGYSENSNYTNCTTDDQSCVCVDGTELYAEGFAGGVAGYTLDCNFYNCINSALIASEGNFVGGIAANAQAKYDGSIIDGCMNTGMVISIKMNEVKNGFYDNYKTLSGMTCVTKTYQGKEYVIRKYDGYDGTSARSVFGGIVGCLSHPSSSKNVSVSRCVNLGSVYTYSQTEPWNTCGGIVGYSLGGNISDCLSDFSGTSKVMAICGITEGKSTIKNCLNITTYGDLYYSKSEKNISGENNYSLTTATDVPLITKTTAAKIKSGEICHLLGENWEQNVGTDAYPTPTGNKGIYHAREVSNEYGTICVPFPVKSDDKISYYSLSEKEEDDQGIGLVFTYVEENEPGVPVLFRSVEAKDADADNPVEICFNNAGEDFTTTPINNNIFDARYWDLWGTFSQKVFDETTDVSSKYIYYVSGDVIKHAKKITIAPYRAYIYGESIDELRDPSTSEAKAIRFVIEDEDGETTALQFVGDDLMPLQQGAKTYSLMGTEVDENYHGIVIKNGKKYLKK